MASHAERAVVIDAHQHCVPAELIGHFEEYLDPSFRVTQDGDGRGVSQHGIYVGALLTGEHHCIADHLAAMDAAGVDTAVLHLSAS